MASTKSGEQRRMTIMLVVLGVLVLVFVFRTFVMGGDGGGGDSAPPVTNPPVSSQPAGSSDTTVPEGEAAPDVAVDPLDLGIPRDPFMPDLNP